MKKGIMNYAIIFATLVIMGSSSDSNKSVLITDSSVVQNNNIVGPHLDQKNSITSKATNHFNDPSTRNQVQWLARIIHAEAKGESFQGKIAVGAVIMNRMKSSEFPKSIYDVIHQKINGRYQFQPIANGQINNVPDKMSIDAAKLAISGTDPTDGALFFYNPTIAESNWIKSLPTKVKIGQHVFAGI